MSKTEVNEFILSSITKNEGSTIESVFDACDTFQLTYEQISRLLSPLIVSQVHEEAVNRRLLNNVPRLPFDDE